MGKAARGAQKGLVHLAAVDGAVAAIVVVRFGLVALAVGLFSTDMLLNVPLTADFSSWYAGNTIFPLLSIAGLAVWGFYTAMGDQQLWKDDAFN